MGPLLADLMADAERLVRSRPAAPGWAEPVPEVVEAVRVAAAPVLLVGGAVVEDGAIPAVHELAAALSAGVLNTVAAKGTYDWRSRHHWATVGLQARDLELAGALEADLLVVSGLLPHERRLLAGVPTPVVEVPTGALAPLAERVARPWRASTYPPLRAVLGAISAEGWEAAGAPLAPSRVTRNYAEVLGPAALVAADAGDVGYWVGRTYTTVAPCTAFVARTRRPGFALAVALACRLHDASRPVLAVVGGEPAPIERDVLDLAAAQGVVLPVERWCDDGAVLDGTAHAARLATLVAQGGEVTIAPDPGQLARMIEAGGAVDMWPEP